MTNKSDRLKSKRFSRDINSNLTGFYVLVVLICFVMLVQIGCDNQVDQSKLNHTVKTEFVDQKSCIECHEKQYTEWQGSHHDLAMDVATEETILGDFNNTTFNNYGLTTTFYKRDGKFFVRTDGPDDKLTDYEISYVFGVDPLQQYMIEFPDGRIQVLDIAWDTHSKEDGGQRWFHLHPDEKITHNDPFHWTELYLNWNYMCAECHSTNLQKNYDLKTDTFQTTWSEIDVGCQACHGPGSNHVEWARSIKETDDKKDRYDDVGLEISLRAEDSRVQIEACARCHSRRNIVNGEYEYGEGFMDHYVPQVLIDPYYYADGQILDEVYVYGSFIQSKKYHHGVRCTDCHNPHTARLHTYGNELCNSCHASAPSREFETITLKDYDTPEHHFHKQDSPGAFCIECHMPETKYMIVDPRRDHSFRVPRPDLSVELDIPNACNRRHKDKSAQWAADKVNEWYPLTKEIRENEIHFAEIFAAGQAGKTEAAPELIKVVSDNSQPAIIRASALNILSRFGSPQTLDVMASSLEDGDPLVRYEAVRAISRVMVRSRERSMQRLKFTLIEPLLKDPLRAVRTEAAHVLTEVSADLFDETQRLAFEKALEEFKQRQHAIEDRPDAHLNLGVMYQNLGQTDMAEKSYKTSIRLADYFIPARFNLANLYNTLGRNNEAEQLIREIIEQAPEYGEAYYSLGLLLAEEKRLEEAVVCLEKAAVIIKTNPRVFYNWGLCLQHLGRQDEAEVVYLKALDITADDYSVIYALTTLYIQQQKWKEADVCARQMLRLNPKSAEVKQLVEYIRQNKGE